MLRRGVLQLGVGVGRCGYGGAPAIASRSILSSQLATKRLRSEPTSPQLTQIRGIETERHTPSTAYPILVAQRKRRPVAPHLSIYRMQINYFTSPFNRITGCLLSGIFYVFGAAYLVAPVFGWHIDSANLAAAFGSLPVGVKVTAKFAMAFPFTFHAVNGVGHLIWDTGRRFSRKAIVTQGWTVVGISLLSAGYLATIV